MVDKTLILRKLSELEQYIVQISEFSKFENQRNTERIE